jgi:hypothetical protein
LTHRRRAERALHEFRRAATASTGAHHQSSSTRSPGLGAPTCLDGKGRIVPYSTLRDKKTELIRKARDGSVFIAPSSAGAITTLTSGSSADLAALPTAYEDLGWTTTDGSTYSRDTTTSDVNSFGSVEPTRSDVTRDVITMGVAAQETKLLTIQLYTGTDLSAALATHTTGEFQVAKPNIPGYKFYRVLGLFVDQSDGGEIYLARFMPRSRITEFGEQQFNDGDEGITYPMTFTGFEDSALGYSHKWIFGGPGWLALLDEMGIDQAST